jgi:N6-adenosine-specific RNA methylase IME4
MFNEMACIFERKNKTTSNFYLVEERGAKPIPLGNKNPLPKGMPTANLPPETVERLKRRAERAEQKPKANPKLPDGLFPVIYADPPWQYDFVQVKDWGVDNHYDTLPLGQIKFYKDGDGRPIQEKFAKDAVLFLWATPPKLRDAMEVIEAWGFQYITQAVWVKNRLGMGYWWMQKHELLLLAKKGNFPAPKTGNRPPSIITAKWNGHSKKPLKVYRMIEEMCPVPEIIRGNGRDYYLECFARGPKRRYWAGFGYEYVNV